MKYFSMFSGIGGFDLALNKYNHECVGFSEIDKYAIQIYEKHFRGVENYGDARKIRTYELPDFNLLCGGFPCQTFSIAGKRKGFEDTRGTLFFEIARVIKRKQPRIVFLENVKGLLNHDGGNTFTKILQTLDELGYDAEWQVLNSKHFGVPQNRERVFIIGHSRNRSGQQIFPLENGGREVITKMKLQVLKNSEYDTDRLYGTEGIARTIRANAGGKGAKTGLYVIPNRSENGRRFKEAGDDISYCVDTGNTNAVEFSNKKIRRLTPTECERLQSFPDGWTQGFSDTQRYKCLGNAVTVNVIKAIIEKLGETI